MGTIALVLGIGVASIAVVMLLLLTEARRRTLQVHRRRPRRLDDWPR